MGRSKPLDSGGDIWCLAKGKLLLSSTTSHSTDNYQPGMYTDTERELDTFGL